MAKYKVVDPWGDSHELITKKPEPDQTKVMWTQIKLLTFLVFFFQVVSWTYQNKIVWLVWAVGVLVFIGYIERIRNESFTRYEF